MIPIKHISENQWLIFIAIAAALLNYYLCVALFPLTDLDEGAYAGVTREMFVRGDWLSTYLNGEPWFEKPVLMYWFQSVGVFFFGVNEWGFRLPSAVASSIWFYLIYRFVSREYDQTTGLMAAIITMTAMGTAFIYKAAIADPFLTLFISIALFSIYDYFQTLKIEQAKKSLILRAFVFMGLGVLAKGPIAIIIPVLTGFIFFLLQGRLWDFIKAGFNPVGWVLLLLIVLPWHIYQYQLFGDAFINDYFFKHNAGRFTSSLDGHAGNLLYYVLSVFLLSFPFWQSITTGLKSGFSALPNGKANPLFAFLIIWFLVVIVFFTFASTKLPHYLMYGMAPLFILAAVKTKHLELSKTALIIAGVSFASVIFALPFAFERLADSQSEPFYRDAMSNATRSVDGLFAVMLLCSLAAFVFIALAKVSSNIKRSLCALLISLQLSWVLMPTVLNYQQEAVKEAALLAIQKDIYPVMYGMNMPSFSVYAQRVTPKREPQPGEWVITESNRLPELGDVDVAFKKNGISLAKKK